MSSSPASAEKPRGTYAASGTARYLAPLARTGRRGVELFFGRTAEAAFTPTHVRKRAHAAWAATAVGAFLRKERLDLEPIGLHEARHTYVSLMHSAGVPLERIGDYVGHSSTYMTDRYRHLIEGQREQDAERFDQLLTGAYTGAQKAETAQ
jgi:integrase